MSLVNNFSNNTNNINIQQNLQNQYTEYPDVFYTNNYNKNAQQSITTQNNNQSKNLGNFFGLSKDMIGQFLPLLFGKSGSENNMLSNILQSGINSKNNNIFSSLFSGNTNITDILSSINKPKSQIQNIANNKKNMPSIIDMSNYKEIKS